MKYPKITLFLLTFASIGGDEKATTDVRDRLPNGALARLGTIRQRVPQSAELAIRPDGRTFVTVVAGRMIGEWDVASGTLRRSRRLPGAPTENRCWFAPNGRLLAVKENGKFVIWDLAEGTQQLVLSEIPWCFAFSTDGKLLAATGKGERSRIYLWNIADGKKRRMAVLSNDARDLAFSPDGRRLFAAMDDGTLHCWDTVSGRQLWQNDRHAAWPVVVSPDGRMLCTAADRGDGKPYVWDAENGRQIKRIALNKEKIGWVVPVAFISDGRSVLIRSTEGLMSWDLDDGKSSRMPYDAGLVLAPNGKTAITFGGALLQRWDVESGRLLYPDTCSLGHINAVAALAFSPDGQSLATSDTNDTILLWDLATRRPRSFPVRTRCGFVRHARFVSYWSSQYGPIDAPPLLTFTPDSQKLLVRSEKDRFSLRRVDNGEETLRLVACRDINERFSTAHIAPDGRTISIWTGCYGEHKDTLSTWDARSGRRLSSRSITRVGDLEAHLISPDGRYAALNDGPVMDVATGQSRLGDASNPVRFRSFAFSSDSRLIAGSCPPDEMRLGEEVQVYEMLTGRLLVRLSAPINQASSYAFSPDGRLLIAAGADALHIWEVSTGRLLLHLPAEDRLLYWSPPHFATCLAIAPDGRSVATGHDDGTVLLWDLSPAWRRLATPREKLTPARRLASWNDMLADDPKPAYRAMTVFTADAAATVSFLADRLRPPPIDSQAVGRWLHDLDADDFAERERASRELTILVDRIEPRLRQALKETTSPEVRRRLCDILETAKKSALPPETVRQLRCVAVLEQIATTEARRLLQDLAREESTARLTEAAQDALRRFPPRK